MHVKKHKLKYEAYSNKGATLVEAGDETGPSPTRQWVRFTYNIPQVNTLSRNMYIKS